MERRAFIRAVPPAVVGAATAASFTRIPAALAQSDLPTIDWQMATSWPLALDTIFGSPVPLQDPDLDIERSGLVCEN